MYHLFYDFCIQFGALLKYCCVNLIPFVILKMMVFASMLLLCACACIGTGAVECVSYNLTVMVVKVLLALVV